MQPQIMPMLSSRILGVVREGGLLMRGWGIYSHMIYSATTQVWSLFSSVWTIIASRIIVVIRMLEAEALAFQ